MKGKVMTEEKRKPGRPRMLPQTVPIQVMITPEQHEWLMNHLASASEVVRQLLSEAMKNEIIHKPE
jgi:hypothetical protein